jgi:hypothetical protein
MNRTRVVGALVLTAIVTAACDREPGRTVESVDEAAATQPVAETAAKRASGEPSCPSFGEPTRTWDASGTPLVFNLRYPEGFEVRKNSMVGDSMYQLDLVRELEFAGSSRRVSISILQSLEPSQDAVPLQVKMMREHADSPVMKAMQDSAPADAGEISFRGKTVPIFRISTDSKVVYMFNLPAEGGFRSVDVHLNALAIGSMCIDRLTELGDAWVRRLTPANT